MPILPRDDREERGLQVHGVWQVQVSILLALPERVLYRVSLLLQLMPLEDSAYLRCHRFLPPVFISQNLLCIPDIWLLCWNYGEYDFGVSYSLVDDYYACGRFSQIQSLQTRTRFL